jgi:hypothetical protein
MPDQNQTNPELLDKLRKLTALAENAGTEAEAALAAQKVADLCEKYNLNIGVAKLSQEETSATEATYMSAGRVEVHINALAEACSQLFDVGRLRRPKSEPVMKDGRVTGIKRVSVLVFYGLRANALAAQMTFEYLGASVEAMLQGWIRTRGHVNREDMRSFRYGCAQRIMHEAQKLKAAKHNHTAPGSDGMALVKLSNQLVANHFKSLKLHKGKTRRIYVAAGAKEAGYAAGGRVDLHGAQRSRMLN